MEEHFFAFGLEVLGDESQYSVGSFVAFLYLFLPIDIFGNDDF